MIYFIEIMPYVYPSKAPTANPSVLIGEERSDGDRGTVVGGLGIPFVIAIFIWVVCLFWLLYYCVCNGKNNYKKGESLEGILLEEEDSAEWQNYHVHDKDHWQSAIREYPSLDINDMGHDMTESVEGSIPYSTGRVSHQSNHSSNRSHNSSLHDAYLIKTLPITPQTAVHTVPMPHHGGPIPITPQSANRGIHNGAQRDHFWKRDPSVSISDIDCHGHSFGMVFDKFRSQSRDLTKQQGWNVGRRESMHEMRAQEAAKRKSSRASSMNPAEHRYTQEFDNHSSEQMTDDSFGDGRSTHHSRSHTPYDNHHHGERKSHVPYENHLQGESSSNAPRYATRYSLRALDPRDHKYNDVSNVLVMSIQLSEYLKERRLEKFIPDLESFGVARTCDLMELHRSDINSFDLQPTKEERQRLENLFLLGAIE